MRAMQRIAPTDSDTWRISALVKTDIQEEHAPTPSTQHSALLLTAAHVAEITRHGEETFPDECCGAILGRVEADGTRVVGRLLPIENQWDEGERRRRFLITPQQYMKLERAADKAGEALIGFYHSHPNAPARPSEFDREHALPWHSYLIASIRDGQYDTMTNWQLKDDRSGYDAVEWRVTGDE
jgi:proteasome lid subunit RPN8/RPN11